MRAIMSIIYACGNYKRAEPDSDEALLVIKAINDVNIPKFITEDIPLFQDIISDLFPGKKLDKLLFEKLDKGIKVVVEELNL